MARQQQGLTYEHQRWMSGTSRHAVRSNRAGVGEDAIEGQVEMDLGEPYEPVRPHILAAHVYGR